MLRKNCSLIFFLILTLATGLIAQTAKRPFKLDDLARLREVRDPQLSPDGQWIAYVVAARSLDQEQMGRVGIRSLPLRVL